MPKTTEPVEVVCPKCRRTQIVYIPKEAIPHCPDCRTPMVLRELLREGKST
jgi:ribosomal protein S27E